MKLPEKVKESASRIASLGHEIALHSNATTWGLVLDREPAECLSEALDALRDAGFDVQGTAPHGDRLRNHLTFYNTECYEQGRVSGVTLPSGDERTFTALPLASFALAYDCDFLLPRVYLCDSGGHWGYGSSKTLEEVRKEFPYTDEEGVDVQLHALVHPEWWDLGVSAGHRRTLGAPDLVEWQAFLDSTDGVVPMINLVQGDRANCIVGLRHDIDSDLENAVRMAEWEAERGYRSTYLLLPGSDYWPFGPFTDLKAGEHWFNETQAMTGNEFLAALDQPTQAGFGPGEEEK